MGLDMLPIMLNLGEHAEFAERAGCDAGYGHRGASFRSTVRRSACAVLLLSRGY
jgi:hypothetical protein